jgi:hypothetical protein
MAFKKTGCEEVKWYEMVYYSQIAAVMADFMDLPIPRGQ